MSHSLVAAWWQYVVQGLVQLCNALQEAHIKVHVADASSTEEGPGEGTPTGHEQDKHLTTAHAGVELG